VLSRTLEEGTPEDDPFVQRLKAQIQLLKERQGLELATDTTSTREAEFSNELALLKQARDAELLTESEYNDEVLELKVRHESQMTGITNRGYLERFKFSQMTLTQQAQFVASTLQSTLAGAAQHNKLAFEAHKAASIANTIISTYTGATKALEWGWPLGPIFAAAITLAGLTNLAYINSTSFQGNGGISGGGGTGGIGSSAPIGGVGVPVTGPPTPQQTTTIVNFIGTKTEQDTVRRFAEAINEARRDGGARFIVVNET
jgi:hypothetical protein